MAMSIWVDSSAFAVRTDRKDCSSSSGNPADDEGDSFSIPMDPSWNGSFGLHR
jgi:hypothetical protein